MLSCSCSNCSEDLTSATAERSCIGNVVNNVVAALMVECGLICYYTSYDCARGMLRVVGWVSSLWSMDLKTVTFAVHEQT